MTAHGRRKLIMLMKLFCLAVFYVCYICINVMIFNLFKGERGIYAKCTQIIVHTLLIFIGVLMTVATVQFI